RRIPANLRRVVPAPGRALPRDRARSSAGAPASSHRTGLGDPHLVVPRRRVAGDVHLFSLSAARLRVPAILRNRGGGRSHASVDRRASLGLRSRRVTSRPRVGRSAAPSASSNADSLPWVPPAGQISRSAVATLVQCVISPPWSCRYRAAVLVEPKRFEVRELPLLDPEPGRARIRLQGCGVCASNIPPWEGRPWFSYPLPPGNPGHEAWGVVDAVGAGVTTLQVGQRVAVLSENAYATYDFVEPSKAVALPASLATRPFPGEPLACAYNVYRRAEILPGQDVAIIGIGFMGALLIALCASAGARVIAIS